ncbi:MAG: DUF11 domain-containing protein [Caldilineaceae bacterium]|nr:DUF11 domain-containing protein [Caldilineaceae bacterium]
MIWLPALLLALLVQGISARPAAAQTPPANGVITCEAPRPVFTSINAYSAEPVLSDNGSLVYFWSTGNPTGGNGDGNIEVFRASVTLDGAALAPQYSQLTTSTGSILGGFNLAPAVSGDGRYVVFFSDRDLIPGQNRDGNFEIFRQDTAPGGQLRQITNTTRGSNLFPAVSQDGRTIVFISDNGLDSRVSIPDAQRNLEIFVYVEGSANPFTQVTNTPLGVINDDPAISGDGKTVVFVSDRDGNSEIYRYRIDSGGQPQQITITGTGSNAHPSISNNGERIVFLSDQALGGGASAPDVFQVFLYPAPGNPNGFKRLTNDGTHGHPAIDGSGNRVVYQRTLGGLENIFLYELSSGIERSVSTNVAGQNRINPVISREGTVVVYEDSGDIVLVNCPIADLNLTTTEIAAVIAGEQVTYMWQVTNNGSSVAANVVVTTTLPGGFSLAGSLPANSCNQPNGSTIVTCNANTLSVGSSAAFTVTLNVAPGVLGEIPITVETASTSVSDPIPANNRRTITTSVSALADLVLDLPRATTPAPLFGELITYTVVISNTGPSVARDVSVTNVLSNVLLYQSSSAGCTRSGFVVTCTQAQMQPGQILTRTIVAQVNSFAEVDVLNEAEVTASTPDPVLSNNRDTRTDSINTTFDLALSQVVVPTAPVAGAPISFTLTITNFGPSVARAVELSLTLPTQFQPALGNDGRPLFCSVFTCTAGPVDTTQPIRLGLGTLIRDQQVEVAIGGIIDPAYSGPITSAATVSSVINPGDDRNAANNSVSQTLPVVQGADLSLLPVTRLSEIVAGAPVTYLLTTRNDGPSVAVNVILTYTLPSSTTFVSASVGGGACSGSTLVTCTFPQLLPGHTVAVTATALIDAAFTDVLTYTVGVTSDIADTQLEFNTLTFTDTVTTRANLVLRNVATPLTAVSGQDSITFTLTITNNGPSLAPAVVITDVLPASLLPLQITPPAGVTCGPLANTFTCSLGNMAPGASRTITVRAAVRSSATGSIVNAATVASAITAAQTVNSAAVITIQRADLSVTKDAIIADLNSNGLIDVGERLTYTVVVNNLGPSNASAIVISDVIPALLSGVTIVTAQGSYAGDVWTVGALTAGSQTTMTVSALLGEATSGRTITNTALVESAGQFDPVVENNGQTLPLTVTLAADLAIAMTVSDPAPKVLDLVTYVITVTNNGPETATGVVVAAPLPSALSYVTHTLPAGSYNAGSGQWTVGALANGASRTLILTARVIGSGQIVNTASASGTRHDQLLSNNSTLTTISVGPAADLSLVQIFSDETPNVGDSLTIVLQVSNSGPDTATDIQVRYLIPSLMIGAAVTPQGTTSYSTTTGIWTIPSLASGSSTTLSINRALSASGVLTSQGEIIASSLFDPDSTPNNGIGNGEDDETSVVKTIPTAADLEVTKAVNAGPFREGSTVFYTLQVRNNGPDPATGVVVTETLPAELQFLTFAFAGNPSTYHVGTDAWNVGNLAVGETKTLFISTRVRTGTAGKQIVDATDGLRAEQYDPNPANNVSNPVSIVIDGADLAVQKSVSNERPNAGETLVYIVTVTNNGPIATTNVVVVDKLPVGITYVESLASQGIYTATTGDWTVGSLAVNGSASLVLTTTVNAGTGGTTITNTVTSATSSVADGEPTNNTPSRAVSVQQADLTVRIDPLDPNPVEGQIIGYNIVVANAGPDLATNVVLTHSLPISLENRGGGPTQGTYDDTTNTWQIGNLARGSSALLNFFAEPKIGTGGQQIDLTIDALEADQEDPTPAITAKGTITVVGADLAVTQIAINDTTPATGENVVYTVTVRNNGPFNTTGIDLRNPVPAGTTFVSASNGATVSGGVIRWPSFSLNTGITTTRSFTVFVTAGSGFTITTTPQLFGSVIPDNFPDNDTRSLSVVVNQPPQIGIGPFSGAFEGSILTATGIFTDDDSSSWPISTINYGDGSGTQPLTLNTVTKRFNVSRIYADNGTYTITVTIGDGDGNTTIHTRAVTIANVAPTVTAHPNITTGIVEGTTFTVGNIATFTDPGFSALGRTETFTYTINWGDNITTTGAVTAVVNGGPGVLTIGAITASHTYADNGNYTVTVRVFDDDGGNQSRTFTIAVANVEPVILTSPADQTVDEGDLVNLPTAVTFADPGWSNALRGSSETFTYSIDWGDGSSVITQPVTSVVTGSVGVSTTGSFGGSHTYADDGVYTVTITLRDDDGGIDTATFTVTVNNVAPTITHDAGDQTVNENHPLILSHVITFTDPGFTALNTSETFTYTIDWGDGSALVTGAVTNVVTGSAGTATVGSVAGQHTYADDDDSPYTVTVSVYDDDGGLDTITFVVTVVNVAPTLTVSSSQTITEGYVLDLPGIGTFIDPGYTDAMVNASETFTYSIDWGDGSALETGIPAVSNGSGGISTTGAFSSSYIYADDGIYTVTVSVYDDNGGSDSGTFTVTVVNEAPTLFVAANRTITEGLPLTIVNILTFTDPGWTDAAVGASELFTYTIEWGDGNQTGPVAVTNVINGGPGVLTRGGVTATHTYADDKDGPYTVTITLEDDDGAVVTDTLIITVENDPPVVTMTGATTVTEHRTTERIYNFTVADSGLVETFSIVSTSCGAEGTVVDGSPTINPVNGAGSLRCLFVDGEIPPITSTVSVVVSDETDTGTGTRVVTVTNVTPSVTPPANQTANEGQIKTFNLGSFTDPGNDAPWTVTVNWGDTSTPITLTMMAPGTITPTAHVYPDNGVYTVTVTVADKDGASQSRTFTITVSNLAPVIDVIAASGTITEGYVLTRAPIASFTDFGYSDLGKSETFTYTINWGDGTSESGDVTDVITGPTAPRTRGAISATHVYADNGVYTVTVTIRDDDGGQHSRSFTVTVLNAAPELNAGNNQTVTEGALVSLDPATFLDRGTLDTHIATVNWGDGSPSVAGTVNATPYGPPGSTAGVTGTISASHRYADDGVYTVTVQLSDDDGATVTDTLTITVTNVAPTVRAAGDITRNEGQSFTLTNIVTFTDPGWSDPGRLKASETFTYSINWGDTSPVITGTVTTIINGGPGILTRGAITGSHTYADNGIYTVTVRIYDDNGGMGTDSFVATVNFNVPPTITNIAAAQFITEGLPLTITAVTFLDAELPP